jgi:hypothetical protein
LTKKVNMYVGYIGILRTIHDCKEIAVIARIERKNSRDIFDPALIKHVFIILIIKVYFVAWNRSLVVCLYFLI